MKKIDTSKFAKDIYQLAMPKLQEINLMTSDEIMRKNEIKNKDIRKLFRYMILSKLPINVFKQKYTNKLSNYKNKFNDKRKVY